MKHEFEGCLQEISTKTRMLAGHPVATKSEAIETEGREIVRLKSIRVPVQRKAVKSGYNFVTSDRGQNLRKWDYIWNNTSTMEVMNQALYFYQHRELNRQELKTILGWADRSHCWEHSDDLSKIYADVVEANPDWILPTLRRWNQSSNHWKRRKSMTSLIEYAVKRTRFLPFAELISYVEPLLDDGDYYVQKGLGWTVREIGNAYPADFSVFMTTNAAILKPQAWSGATKNMSKTEKQKFKGIRMRAGKD